MARPSACIEKLEPLRRSQRTPPQYSPPVLRASHLTSASAPLVMFLRQPLAWS